MAKMKEFRVVIEDKPGALGRCCRALAEHGVNVLAFQSYVEEGESLARFLVNDARAALAALGGAHLIFEEVDVAVVRLTHQPGELARAAAALGEHHINIDHSYSGLDPESNLPLGVFGVDAVSKASSLLDELSAQVR